MSYEPTLSSLLLQEGAKLSAGVLPAVVGVQALHTYAMLGLCPCHKCFVGHKGLILCVKDMNTSVLGVIVCECDVVFPPPYTVERRWPPYIYVYLCGKSTSQ